VDELFEQIFVFIPLALLLFFRFFFESGKRKRQQAQGALGTKRPESIEDFISSLFGGKKRDAPESPPDPSAKAQHSPAKPHGAAQLPARELGLRGSRYLISEDDQPMYAPAASSFEDAITLGDLAQSLPNAQVQSISGAKESEARSALMASRAANPPQAKGGLAGRVDELPALQKALVMAEILGKPKSLSEQ
jgi:hypothetical protein